MLERIYRQYEAQFENGQYTHVPAEIIDWCQNKVNDRKELRSLVIQCFGALESRDDQQNIIPYTEYLDKCLEYVTGLLYVDANRQNEPLLVFISGSASDHPEAVETCKYLQEKIESRGSYYADDVLFIPAGKETGDSYLNNIKIPKVLSCQIGKSLNPPQKILLKSYTTDKWRVYKTALCLISEGVNPLLAVGIKREEIPKNPKNNALKQSLAGFDIALRNIRNRLSI